MNIKEGMKILFQGDSITDCGRNREDLHGLTGYNALIAEKLASKHVECFNRGVSGDRAEQALLRMECDCIQTKPDIVSILLGINDTWRRFDSNFQTTTEEFMENYRKVLQITQKYAPQIVILEPFLIDCDPAKEIFRIDLDPKIQALRKLAKEFAVDYIPLDGIFAERGLHESKTAFTADGVHPNDRGNALIAEEFLKRINV